MSTEDTRTALLDAAETLFAEQGFAATSLRALTNRAGANLAAVNYHFGGKEELALAVLARRITPVNAERHARLDRLGARPTTEAIVRAFVEPVFRGVVAQPGGAGFSRMMGRFLVEQPPFLRRFLAGQFRDLGRRFETVLRVALPGVDPVTLWWRLHFLVGAMAHTLQNAATLVTLSDGRCRPDDTDRIVAELVEFATGGFTNGGRRPRRTRRRETTDR